MYQKMHFFMYILHWLKSTKVYICLFEEWYLSSLVLALQVRSSSISVLRSLNTGTCSTQASPLMRGWMAVLFFRESITISFAFVGLRSKLLIRHHSDSRSISSLYTSSPSLPKMSPTTIVSSVNFMILLPWWVGTQSLRWEFTWATASPCWGWEQWRCGLWDLTGSPIFNCRWVMGLTDLAC